MLEDRLRAHPLVSQCMVVGDAQPFIGALITLDAEALPAWLERKRQAAGHVRRRPAWTTPRCARRSARRSPTPTRPCRSAEQIREFRILPVDFTEEGGEMTPTPEGQARVVAEHFADDIAAIFYGSKQPA